MECLLNVFDKWSVWRIHNDLIQSHAKTTNQIWILHLEAKKTHWLSCDKFSTLNYHTLPHTKMSQPTTNNYIEPSNKNDPLKRWNIFLVVLLVFQCLYLVGQASGLIVDIVGLPSLRLSDGIKGLDIRFEVCKSFSFVYLGCHHLWGKMFKWRFKALYCPLQIHCWLSACCRANWQDGK